MIAMLQAISYQFPTRTEEEQEFFQTLSALLRKLPNATLQEQQIHLTPIQPQEALPVTIFEPSDISFPQIIFTTPIQLDLQVGNVYLRSSAAKHSIRVIDPGEKLTREIRQDSHGSYLAITKDEKSFSLLPIQELYRRLTGHIVRMDHTGFNIPDSFLQKQAWDVLINQLARETNIYNYPTGDLWPFILPVTKKEYIHDITDFSLGREPKFELVYDTYSAIPTIQIDIESDLPRHEVENLLPAPYGISFPDVAEFFRSAYIDHPWNGLAIRFDIRFRNDHPGGDWDTGKWLVKDGKRIRSSLS